MIALIENELKLCLLPLNRREEAASRPKLEFVPKTIADLVVEGELGKLHTQIYGDFG